MCAHICSCPHPLSLSSSVLCSTWMMGWFSGVYEVVFLSRKALSQGFIEVSSNGAKVSVKLLNKAFWAIVTCIFAIGGALVGCFTGAITGQTTEAGFLHEARIGAISGVFVAVELLDSLIDGCFKSKVAHFGRLVRNGEVFTELVSPLMLMEYDQLRPTMQLDANYNDLSDIFDINESKGVSHESVKKLPVFNLMTDSCDEIICTICLENFKEGECARRLTNCRHFFHLGCIDAWLVKHGSCPICRLKCT